MRINKTFEPWVHQSRSKKRIQESLIFGGDNGYFLGENLDTLVECLILATLEKIRQINHEQLLNKLPKFMKNK